MRTNSVLVAALAAAASVVSAAEGQRPKIYFPRHLKRQYSNVSITTESPVSQSTPFEDAPETTKRDSISDLLASLNKPTFTDKPTFISTSSDASSSADTTDFGDSSSGSVAQVTTIVVESTIVVPPSTDPTPVSSVGSPVTASAPSSESSSDAAGVASTGGIPATIILPTSSDPVVPVSASPTDTATDAVAPTASTVASDAASSDTASPSADPTSSGLFSSAESSVESTSTTAILLAPTGIVTSTSDPSPTLSDPLAPISSILSSVVSEVTSAILPSPNVTDTAAPEPTTSTPTSEDPASPSAEPTVTPSASAQPTDPSASASPTTPETEQPTATATQDPTTALPEPTSSDIGISLSLTLLPPGTGSSTVADTTPPATEEPTGQPTTVIPPPASNTTDTSIPTVTSPSSEPTGTAIDPTTTPDPTNTAIEPTSPPGSGNATATEPSQTLSTPETTIPGTTVSDVTVPPTTEPTLLPTVSPILPNVTSSDNTTIPDTVTQLPPPPTTSSSPTSIDTASGVTSIAATATLSGANTNTWLPTTIVVDQPPTGSTTQILAPTSATALPSALPKAITPDSGNTDTPVDTTIIGIGFKYTLNYEFVVGNSKAAAQIFEYLPPAVRSTGDFPAEKVILKKLVPLDTVGTLGYWTTIALMTYPSNMIDQLRLDVRTPNSPLYNQDSEIVSNLTAQINTAIDIIYGLGLNDDGTTASGAGSPAATSSGGAQADPFGNTGSGDGTSKPGQQGTTAGIALGVIGVAGAYGAAMFIIARRYKRKRQAHRRTSSLTDPSEMRSAAGSPHLMGGALLSRDFSSYGGVAGGRDSHGTQGSGRSGANNSARTAYISGPMSAENSLGWN